MPAYLGRPDRSTRTLLAAVSIAALLALTTACGSSGRTLRAPAPGATAPPRHPDSTTTSGPVLNTAAPSTLFTLDSPAFAPGHDLPAEITCDGAGTSPPFTWSNVPAEAVELALVITDPDAGNYVHWAVAGIAPTTPGLTPGTLPAGSVVLRNTAGAAAYAPLCPPAGQTHSYEFTLYALPSPSGLTAGSDTGTAITSLATKAVGTAVLTGSYTRPAGA